MGNEELVKSEQGGIISTVNSIKHVASQIKQIHEIFKKNMIKDVHYGKIPGTEKNTLYKAGAELLAFYFNMSAEYEKDKTDLSDNHREYEFSCKLRDRRTGFFLGEGVGSCSTLEAKYRYRNESRKCPICGLEKIIKGKEEYGGGWLCYGKKGGCGAKFKSGDSEIESQTVGKIEHEDPADYYNTVLKQGKKRSYVDSVITVTASGEIFDQKSDLPEYEEEIKNVQKQPEKSIYDENTQEPSFSDLENGNNKQQKKQPEQKKMFSEKEKDYAGMILNFIKTEYPDAKEAGDFLENLTGFTHKTSGNIVAGKRKVEDLTLPRQKICWHEIEKLLASE